MFIVDDVTMKQQIRNLNCGRYCLEALMQRVHGCPFGRETAPQLNAPSSTWGTQSMHYGRRRTRHSAAVMAHISSWHACGFDPGDHASDYGLAKLARPTTAKD